MTKTLIILILLAVMITGCEKTVTIALPDESNKLVLNLIMNKDSIMMARVNVSERINMLQPTGEIKDAVVKLYEDGTYKETFTPYIYSGRTYYRSTTLPRAGATYKVTAATTGYTDVWGSDIIPDTVEIGELKLNFVQVNNYDGRATISVQWHDDHDIQNYYRVRAYYINEWYDSNGNVLGWQKIQQFFEAEEASLGIFGENNNRPDFFTTDALFNGRSPRFTFRFNTRGTTKKIIVEISALTYNSYNYLLSAAMAREKNEDGLSEKVIVFNNIENGLGIVGGVAQREYMLVR